MNFVRATREFEAWVGTHTSIVRGQLSAKHKLMAKDSVRFLRGSFYRWIQVWSAMCPDLARSVPVLAVGDLHIASFGTWRDRFGRLTWGVDDFDEAYRLAYCSDLVRLAVSVFLDASEGDLAVGVKNICDVVLDGYRDGLVAEGKPFVLEEQHKWLREIALDHLDQPGAFWRKMDELPSVRTNVPADAKKALKSLLPDPSVPHRIVRRTAGVGSLGHPRYVAVTAWQGGQIAVEAKAAIPSACAWANPKGSKKIQYQTVLDRAVRSCDPFVRLNGNWLAAGEGPYQGGL